MKKIILFDLDGTLIDSTDAIVGTFTKVFNNNSFNFQGTVHDIKKEIGYPLEIMFQNLGVEHELSFKFVDDYKAIYREISKEQTELLEKSIESLEIASKFARLGIVTTKTTLYTIPLLEHLDIMKYFETIVGRQEVENPKPHPEPIFKAMNNMNINNKDYDVWMIGDTKLDIIAANEAQIKSVAVLCGYGSRNELSKYTKNITHTSYEAVQLIKNF